VDACLSDKPSAPRNLSVVECSKDYVDLSWRTPETDGGSAVVQYIIEKRDITRAAGAGGAMWMVCGTVTASELTMRVGKLLQGNSYIFRVAAENRVGPGPPTELPEPVIARLPYGASGRRFFYSCEIKIYFHVLRSLCSKKISICDKLLFCVLID